MEDLQQEFITKNQALKLKTLGFNKPCLFLYNLSDDEPKPFLANPPEPMDWNSLYVKNTNKHLISAPTFSQAFRWFRDKHNLYIKPDWCWSGDTQFLRFQIWKKREIKGVFSEGIYIFKDNNKFKGEDKEFYYKAEILCIDKLIEIIEQKES